MSSQGDPLIIAELSANSNGSVERAILLVDAAKDASADLVKLQAYSANSITIDHDGPGFIIKEGVWAGRKLIDLYYEAETSPEIIEAVFAHCKTLGIGCFASVFDKHAVDFIATFDPPFYKIASFEVTDTPLIKYAASKGKPLILSTGMANNQEIGEALDAANSSRTTLLHCISSYPTEALDYNLGRMQFLADRFKVPIGLSDHSLSTTLPAVAIALGATVIEKHLTLSRADGGPDSSFSLEPHEFKVMVTACREARAVMNIPKNIPEPHRDLRRSLYVVKDIAADEQFTEANVRSIRPGYGMAPKHLPSILGRFASQALTRGTPLSLDHIAP